MFYKKSAAALPPRSCGYPYKLCLLDDGDAGQLLALEVLERSAAAGGDVGHLVAQAHLLDLSLIHICCTSASRTDTRCRG